MLGLRARDCRTGEILDQEEASGSKKEDVLNALGQIANRFQNPGGQSLPVWKNTRPLCTPKLTTASLEAWRSFKRRNGRSPFAIQNGRKQSHCSKRTVEIDPKFAMAYA